MTSENLSNEQNPRKTIKDLVTSWLDRITNRRRKPCKPATLSLFSYYLANHLNPLIGDADVEVFRINSCATSLQRLWPRAWRQRLATSWSA